jgi:DNA repair exonuclease SbcCD ATPase subunit
MDSIDVDFEIINRNKNMFMNHIFNNVLKTSKQLIKVDYKTFINSAYFRQDDISEFSESDPAQKKKILKSIVDISKWDDYEEKAKDNLKELRLEAKIINSRLDGYDDLINEYNIINEKLQEDKSALAELMAERQLTENNIQFLNQKYLELKKTLDTDRWDNTIEQIHLLKRQQSEEELKNKTLSSKSFSVYPKLSIQLATKICLSLSWICWQAERLNEVPSFNSI